MHNHLIPRIASILIGTVLGVILIFLGFQVFQNLFSRAEDVAPHDVIVSDITQNSVKVTWATGQENQGVVEYGTSPTALNFFAPESSRTKSHSVDLTLLSPTTTYYFQIRIADKKYDNGGVPWTFTTKGNEKSSATDSTSSTLRPTPVATLTVPEPTAVVSCNDTDCTKIKAKIGNGCNVSDYLACTSKSSTPSATPTK